MRLYFYIFKLILCFALTHQGLAQKQELNFKIVPPTSGVSLSKINSMVQDKYGFMWFADRNNLSLVRYDGNHMKRYAYQHDNPNSLASSPIECLAADPSGAIWIGYQEGGLDRFDPSNNTFTHFRHNKDDPASLSSDFVSAILVDRKGNLWVGTRSVYVGTSDYVDEGDLHLLDQHTGKFRRYSPITSDSTSLTKGGVSEIYEDRQGILWVGTGFPWGNGSGGLNRFNPDTETFTRYMHDKANPNSLSDNVVRSIFEDSDGNFWIGTRGNSGLHIMDRATGQFQRIKYDPFKPGWPGRPPVYSPTDHITFITEDSDKHLWIGLYRNGVIRYNPESKESTYYGYANNYQNSKDDLASWRAYSSSNGLIWLATQFSQVVYKVDLYSTVFPKYATDSYLGFFLEESPSVTWKGSSNGLIRENSLDGTIKIFKHDPHNPNSISNNVVLYLYKDKDGVIWIGTADGLNAYDPATNAFTKYLHDPTDSTSLPGRPVDWIYEDTDRNMWVAIGPGGITKLDRNSGKFNRELQGFKPNDLRSLYEFVEIDDVQWFKGDNQILRLDKKTGLKKVFLKGAFNSAYFIDQNGILWTGGYSGLYRFNRLKDDFERLDIEGGVSSIMGLDDDNLWITSTLGLIKLNTKTDQKIVYGPDNGINEPTRMRQSKIYKTNNNKLIIGPGMSTTGYYEFHPERVKVYQDTSKLYFTNFTLNGKSVMPSKDGPLRESIFTAERISLTHDQNIFTIFFTEIDFRNNSSTKIDYMLENYDVDWRQSFAEEPVSYIKVPPGHYTLKIKAINSSSGLYVQKSLNIVIAPPWWKTWWAYGVYSLLFIGGVYLTDRLQRKRLLEKAKVEAREKELEQARKIEKAYTELKATQAQLIQSEKMASLGELTAGIAHEIQNPLNFVNNFSEVNEELLVEMKDELDKGNIDDAKAIANDAIENQQKILHHGKRADAIVKGMLQHSRSSSGVKEPTNINALADEYLRLAYHGLRAKDKSFNATMKTDFDDSIGNINVVPQDIGRVILNLFTNAFYAVTERKKQQSDDYEPTVSVSTKKSGKKVLISVSDNGLGIPPHILDKIFQPFFTTKPTGQGTGLGLSMSYDIVTNHGGELKVNTKENEGSTFIIILPQ